MQSGKEFTFFSSNKGFRILTGLYTWSTRNVLASHISRAAGGFRPGQGGSSTTPGTWPTLNKDTMDRGTQEGGTQNCPTKTARTLRKLLADTKHPHHWEHADFLLYCIPWFSLFQNSLQYNAIS